MALGIPATAIDYRVKAGRLRVVHRGVYAIGHRRPDARARWMGAVLACGEGSLLSWPAAGSLWDMAGYPSRIDVTTPRSGGTGPRGIFIHRCTTLHPDDRAICDGIPVTSVARTLLDAAGVLIRRRLERAIEQAERLQLFDSRAVQATLARNPRLRGAPLLRDILEDQHGPPPDTRSELERLFLDFCRDYHVALPRTNVLVHGYEVDAYWPDQRLVVELDSFEFHKSRAAFERDRERDMELRLAGEEVVRVTDRRIRRDPVRLAASITGLLAARAG